MRMKKSIALLFVLLFIAGAAFAQILEEKQKLYRIYVEDFSQIKHLEKKGISIYNLNPEGYIEVLALPGQIVDMRRDGFEVNFIANSFKEIWDNQPDFKAGPEYHDYAETIEELENLAATYPDITQLTTIGESVAGRTIACIKVSDNAEADEDEPPVLIVGNHHGNEVLSVEATLFQLNYLLENYGSDNEVTYWVDNMEIWFVPLLNPDGREAVRRTNDNGVDLNRNYSFGFTAEGNHGPEGFSEPETRAIRDLAAQFPPIMSLTYHTSGRYVLYSWTHTDEAAPDSAAMIYLGNKVAESIIYPSGGATDDYLLRQGGRWYFTAGEYCDYMYAEHNTLAFTVEMWSSQTPDGSVIPEVVARNLEGFKTLLRQVNKAGVTGLITDASTGDPIVARIDLPQIDDQGKLPPRYSDTDFGRYYRYFEPGEYRLSISAEGYRPQLIDVVITEDNLLQLDIIMQPGPLLAFDEANLLDGNGNGLANLGETLGMQISLANAHPIGATDVWARVISTNNYLEILTDSLFFGAVDANSSTLSADTLFFEIAADCPNATELSFELEISDSEGLGWLSTFVEEVYAPVIEIETIVVDDSNWNANGTLDIGERAHVSLVLTNNGRQIVNSLNVSIETNETLYTIHENSFIIENLGPDESGSFVFDIELSAEAPAVLIGNFVALVNSDEGYAPELQFSLNNINGYYYDFEGGMEAWTHDSYKSTSNHHDDWQLGKPAGKAGDPDAAYSGDKCWGTDMGWELFEGEGWNGEYQSSVFNYLQSPVIDCSNLNGVGLKYRRWLNTRLNDVGRVLVNDQVVWQSLKRGHSDTSWSDEEIDISALADNNSEVVIVFELQTNNNTNLGGWNVDDVIVANGLFPSSGIDYPFDEKANMLEDIFPNPFSESTTIRYRLGESSRVELIIRDHFGRLIETLVDAEQSAGTYRMNWDGMDDFGNKLASGIYFYSMKTDQGLSTKRMILISK